MIRNYPYRIPARCPPPMQDHGYIESKYKWKQLLDIGADLLEKRQQVLLELISVTKKMKTQKTQQENHSVASHTMINA
jgi:preprotein translocase subunit SecA